MKKIDFENIKDELTFGKEVLIRYFTYSKKEYVDIIGKVFSNNSFTLNGYNNYFITIQYIDILKYHNNFNGINIPNIPMFNLSSGNYFNASSNNMIFIKPFSIRSYKINKIKKSIPKIHV